jgi:hypothetical protein
MTLREVLNHIGIEALAAVRSGPEQEKIYQMNIKIYQNATKYQMTTTSTKKQ